MKKLELFLLLLILFGGFIVRLYHFSYPIADWHSWRQSDTSAVSRNFVQNGFDLFHPKFDDLSRIPSGFYENPQGYRFVEFPIYNVLQAKGFIIFDRFTLEEWGRIITIFSSLISTILIFFLVARHATKRVALLSAFFFSFLPFNIFWGRTVLPDSTATLATLSGLLFFDLWVGNYEKRNYRKYGFFIFSIISLAFALLLKPFTAFFFLPVLWTSYRKWGISAVRRLDLWTMLVLAALPWAVWRFWSLQFPAGVPQSGWLFNGGDIRFKGAFFQWIFAQRIAQLILGFWGVTIFSLGVLVNKKNYFISFLAASLFYLVVVAKGNVQHSYYQIPIIPTVAIFLAIGTNFLLNPPKQFFSKLISLPLLFISLIFMFSFSWFQVRDYYNIQDNSIVLAGQAVDRLTPKDAKIIAPYDGDTTLLYLSNRKGWPVWEKPLPDMIKLGADYLIFVHTKKTDLELGKIYRIIANTPDYIIFDLHKKP